MNAGLVHHSSHFFPPPPVLGGLPDGRAPDDVFVEAFAGAGCWPFLNVDCAILFMLLISCLLRRYSEVCLEGFLRAQVADRCAVWVEGRLAQRSGEGAGMVVAPFVLTVG
jgi:hypothetical protein